MESMPDCAIPGGRYEVPQDSLHGFLRRYMEIENRLISDFYENDPDAVYSYRLYFGESIDWYEGPALFHSFDEVYARSKEDFDDPSPKFAEYVKTYIGTEEKQIFVRFNLEKEIVCVDENNKLTDEEDDELFRAVFESMSFAFPTPFCKGDIVKATCGRYRKPSYWADTFALTDIRAERGGGMAAHGFFISNLGEVYSESNHNYMDLEYVRDGLGDEDRLLVPIGKYLRGEIDLGSLLGAQRVMLCENEAKAINRSLNYPGEGERLAGIEG